tara:strand:+ start:164205 stop:165143 length:939 start_codon:yes stop_codon:yes gene_type:complete
MNQLQDKTALSHRPDATRCVHSRRSALYVPANNHRAMQKAAALACDAIIFDLEDAIGPDDKPSARKAIKDWFGAGRPPHMACIIRINALSSAWGMDDLEMAAACAPDAILLPKIETPSDIRTVQKALDDLNAAAHIRLWAMIETPRGLVNCQHIADTGMEAGGRLDCLIVGTNDLAKETGVDLSDGRQLVTSWLMQIILAARAAGLDVLDGVYNNFRDLDGYRSECETGRSMGFDGKTLIHPSQIDTANATFGASAEALADASAIVAAFALPQNSGKGVIQMDGKMVERLHLEQAEKLLAKAALQQKSVTSI